MAGPELPRGQHDLQRDRRLRVQPRTPVRRHQDPATQAYRARYAELYDQRTRTETQLTALRADTPADNHPALFDLLPIASAAFTDAPTGSKKSCSPHSTSTPSTGTTRTRSPSGPLAETGRQAVELLLRSIAGEPVPSGRHCCRSN
jgi:hypothetical protein